MNQSLAGEARRSLRRMVGARTAAGARQRLDRWIEEAGRGSRRGLFIAFSALPGVVGKADLEPGPAELAEAAEWAGRCGVRQWSVDQAARACLLLHYRADSENEAGDAGRDALHLLFSAADVREQVALLQVFPLLPFPSRHRLHAEAAVRSSITSVFAAIAFDNAYPYEQFDEAQWNRMVLKALFQDLGLERIQGLDARRNAELARMAEDLVRERRAAGRALPPDIERVLSTAEEAK